MLGKTGFSPARKSFAQSDKKHRKHEGALSRRKRERSMVFKVNCSGDHGDGGNEVSSGHFKWILFVCLCECALVSVEGEGLVSEAFLSPTWVPGGKFRL